MSLSHFRPVLICLLLLGSVVFCQAGMSSYTDKGKTDFDTFLQLLNPYGKWSKINGKWAFTPTDHEAPYTNGRWLYTEFGWYWKGKQPHSWATEHYGYWKRGLDKVWSWYPGPIWLPQIVEIRATSKYIGWRSGAVDNDGNFVEQPIQRYSKPEEWTFVTLEQFANPITPGIIAPAGVAEDELEDSTDCRHTYMTYRAIERPGPHPADFVSLCKDGGMFAPKTMSDLAQVQSIQPKAPDTNSVAAKMTGTTPPELLDDDNSDAGADPRKVKYWITMSLPTFWTKPPGDAKPEEIYLYRPDIFQDQDGIQRRVTLWFNPQQRTTLKDLMSADTSPVTAPASGSAPTPTPKAAAGPAVPAVPADEASQESNPFKSPLDEPYQPGSTTSHRTNPSSKNIVPAGTNAAPSGAN